MQLVDVTIFILSFFLVQIGMYMGHGWLQAMQPPFSYTASTPREISPSSQYNAECCRTQNGFFQFVNAFKHTKKQFIPSHNVPAAKRHVSAALTHEKFPDMRKQTLKVKQRYAVHLNMVTPHYAASQLSNNSPLSSMYHMRKLLLMTNFALIRIKQCSSFFSRKKTRS